MIKEVAFVAVAVTDIDRARKFYEGALGLKPASAPAGVPWRMKESALLRRRTKRQLIGAEDGPARWACVLLLRNLNPKS